MKKTILLNIAVPNRLSEKVISTVLFPKSFGICKGNDP